MRRHPNGNFSGPAAFKASLWGKKDRELGPFSRLRRERSGAYRRPIRTSGPVCGSAPAFPGTDMRAVH